MDTKEIIPSERIINKIFLIRGIKVMLDKDLAELYRVETGQLKRAVKRNLNRFPKDFMFKLSNNEFKSLRCQIGISNRGGTRYLPMAFTEQGVAMLSSVLNSERAVQVNIQIIRIFTKLREILLTHKELREKIEEMEKKYNGQFRIIFDVIKKLLENKTKPTQEIGFKERE